jgi:hypothetical protein
VTTHAANHHEVTLVHLGMTDTAAARALGYKSPATLWKIRQGKSFVGVERLVALARISKDRVPNLHWLLTGEGAPFIISADRQTSEAVGLVLRLNSSQRRAISRLMLPRLSR